MDEHAEFARRVLPPAPSNPFDLGRHLVEQHDWTPGEVDGLDSIDLRRAHRDTHAVADDRPGRLRHLHADSRSLAR